MFASRELGKPKSGTMYDAATQTRSKLDGQNWTDRQTKGKTDYTCSAGSQMGKRILQNQISIKAAVSVKVEQIVVGQTRMC